PPPTKAQLRNSARALRDALPDISSAVCEHLADWLQQRRQYTVLAYKAFGSEVSLEPLPALLPEIRFLTTRVGAKHALTLHEFAAATVQNRFGILEPPPDAPCISTQEVDVVLVPGLAFTRAGARLGYGAGFYDRLLPQLRSDCLRVGITQSALLLPWLPLEAHDLHMQFLALENGVIVCNTTVD
ncbi:MAG: 5-formyltetrahydrofolate cyclo-ligase, partial [Deinococcales bacterium]